MTTPTDRLSNGFTPAPLPPAAPDGGPQLEPAPTGPISAGPISRCQLGPCRHYHELFSELDDQKPLDGTGTRLAVIATRTCYPSAGAEIELQETAVRDCNRWEPLTTNERDVLKARRDAYERAHASELNQFYASWKEADASR